MTDPQVAVSMLAVLILAIFLGFPVAFTLMALGVGYGFYAYYDQALLLRVYERLLGDETGALMESFTGSGRSSTTASSTFSSTRLTA
jgi:TRAP-type mannitol/chloroaromatic compound transport system permease large subunit